MKYAIFIILVFSVNSAFTQSSYKDSVDAFIKNYVTNHEVVKGEDRKQLHFFDVNEKYRVVAKFEKATTDQWFEMPTSGRIKKVFRVYGVLSFTINDTLVKLNL